MYNLNQDVIKGMNIVTALQNHPNMPGINQLFVELDYFAQCLMETEKYYGVEFKRKATEPGKQRSEHEPQFDAVSDVKGHLREFYFGGSQEQTFGFRPRALFCMVIEPLLESMEPLSHDEILDNTESVIEQLKEYALIADHEQKLDAAVAYKLYRQITTDRVQEKKIKEAVDGVMKLRRKTLAIQEEIKRQGKS